MFSLVSNRYERVAMIVTSNKPFSWGEIFGDDMAATAMIDRLIHHSEILAPRATATDSAAKTSDTHGRQAHRNRLTQNPSGTSPRALQRRTTRRSSPGTDGGA